jgi:BMFP domain-containing protein YqiC
MIARETIEQLGQRIASLLDGDSHSLRADVKKNLDALLRAAFERMDLVTREEFDIQQALLLRTRERLEALEAEVAELERQLAQH